MIQAKCITTLAVLLNENNNVSNLEDGVQVSKTLASKIDATARSGLLPPCTFSFQSIKDSFLKLSTCKELSFGLVILLHFSDLLKVHIQ
jgi:hypothetical protein